MGESWIPPERYPLDEPLTRFAGLPVNDFTAGESLGLWDMQARRVPAYPIIHQAEQRACRIGLRPSTRPEHFAQRVATLLADPASAALRALVVGHWDGGAQDSTQAIAALTAAAAHLPGLRALFFGELTREEQEMSWLVQSDHAPLLRALPRLEEYVVRGSRNLRFASPFSHPSLQRLTVQGGDLPGSCLRDIAAADLPALRHLAIWLGPADGPDAWTVEDLHPLLDGTRLPRLESMALVNSDHTDAVASALAKAPLLDRLQGLDLSLGTLGDVGGEALLASPRISRLQHLDLHHHYLSNGVMARFRALGIAVDLGTPRGAHGDPDDRYCAVPE